ncbi:unnamed protein product [Ostreobium quekettii]|uniref:Uncharacterized protein n=1 Tax=Ostreobium quekettii TaxID=121088 RepID=A0A8S1ILR3_9CHLO|nr:unnamed protein product [Ostreobium quekettii]
MHYSTLLYDNPLADSGLAPDLGVSTPRRRVAAGRCHGWDVCLQIIILEAAWAFSLFSWKQDLIFISFSCNTHLPRNYVEGLVDGRMQVDLARMLGNLSANVDPNVNPGAGINRSVDCQFGRGLGVSEGTARCPLQ